MTFFDEIRLHSGHAEFHCLFWIPKKAICAPAENHTSTQRLATDSIQRDGVAGEPVADAFLTAGDDQHVKRPSAAVTNAAAATCQVS